MKNANTNLTNGGYGYTSDIREQSVCAATFNPKIVVRYVAKI
jgi:hypothetical protein